MSMSEDINFVKSVYFCGMETPPEEAVLKVKHSSVRIENPLLACISGAEYFSLARTFKTA